MPFKSVNVQLIKTGRLVIDFPDMRNVSTAGSPCGPMHVIGNVEKALRTGPEDLDLRRLNRVLHEPREPTPEITMPVEKELTR